MKRAADLRNIAAVVMALSLWSCTRSESPHQNQAPLKVPAGARLQVALIDGVSTSDNVAGDRFSASLVEPLVIDGRTVLAKGTRVIGSVADVDRPGQTHGSASLMLVLQSVEQQGDDISIATRPFVAAAPEGGMREAVHRDLYYPPQARLDFTLASELEATPAIP